VIYVDSSVILAELLDETRKPPQALWDADLEASRLVVYEIWNRIHAYGVADQLAEQAAVAIKRILLVAMSEDVLARALQPFPIAVRTLDALHLSTATHLRAFHPELRLATYDDRMRTAAAGLGIPLFDLPP
jgi:predicted nucleic acid-binding protein